MSNRYQHQQPAPYSPECIAHGCSIPGSLSDSVCGPTGDYVCQFHHGLARADWGKQTMLTRKHQGLIMVWRWFMNLNAVEEQRIVKSGFAVNGYPDLTVAPDEDWRAYRARFTEYVQQRVRYRPLAPVSSDRTSERQAAISVPRHIREFVMVNANGG